jgi:two-component system, NtrC family, response regulator AtoC
MKEKILIVDDDPEMLKALELTLKDVGYQVTTADCGEKAISLLNLDDFALMITDMKMPKMSGLELIENVNMKGIKICMIMITAFGSIDVAVNAMKAGALDFIEKPFSPEKLIAIVEKAFEKIEQGKIEQNGFLKDKDSHEIVFGDPKMTALIKLIERIAHSDVTVLLKGESGTGKELVARFIHKMSKKKDGAFVAVNCAALPEGLLESELFGHEKGAFTGAINKKMGKFMLADSGTLLLDEISELNMSLQAKLLRVLQEGEIDMVGGKSPIPVNVRVIATTNKDLKACVKKGEFRQDLFFRLNVFPIDIPPLRERLMDIPLLVDHFCKKYNPLAEDGCTILTEEAIQYLQKYQWPGNVRELENVIQRAVLMKKRNKLKPEDIYIDTWDDIYEPRSGIKVGASVEDMEKELIMKTLEKARGNKTEAAVILGISVRTLRNKLNQYKGFK